MRKRNMSIFLGLLMLFSTLAFSFFSKQEPVQQQKQPLIFVTVWKGANVYAQNTSAGTMIYYLQLGRNVMLPLRANPAEAEQVPANFEPGELYEKLFSINKLYYLFDPKDKDVVGLAYADLGRFIANRPFEVVYGTTEPYKEGNNSFPYHDPWNVSDGEFAIYFHVDNNTDLVMINNTLLIEGPDRWELVKAATKVELILAGLLR